MKLKVWKKTDDSEDADDDFDEEEGHPASRMLSDAGDGEVEEFEASEQTEEGADGAQVERVRPAVVSTSVLIGGRMTGVDAVTSVARDVVFADAVRTLLSASFQR